MEIKNKSLQVLIDKFPDLREKLEKIEGRFPVPIGEICDILGIDVFLEELANDISGRICFSDNKFIIVVNSSKPNLRNRFTIAHELGHCCYHNTLLKEEKQFLERVIYTDKVQFTDDYLNREIEADNFAAELLMPQYKFFEEFHKRDIYDYQIINSLADYFKVSFTAARVRASTLRLFAIT